MVDISILDEPIDETQPSFSSQSTYASTTSMRSTSSDAIEKILFKQLFEEFPDDDNDSLFVPDSDNELGGGKVGTLPIKYHIKKSITTRKNKNKPRTKSKTPARRITIRIKRLMKSKFTKPKTYKRRATGGKRKSKPNKTMRRYRRVRK